MRPKLNKYILPKSFLDYYWLKAELLGFCDKHDLSKEGKKEDLQKRIYHFLTTGNVLKPIKTNKRKDDKAGELSLQANIPIGYRNDERHRAFFKCIIGQHFKFNVPFMDWMKRNAGKTYQQAINEWQ